MNLSTELLLLLSLVAASPSHPSAPSCEWPGTGRDRTAVTPETPEPTPTAPPGSPHPQGCFKCGMG